MEYKDILSDCTGLFWNGSWQSPSDRQWFSVVDPATQEEVGRVLNGLSSDAISAAQSAETAMMSWRKFSALDRSDILEQVSDMMLEYKKDLSNTIVKEVGKPFREAEAEVISSVDFFRWYSEEARRLKNYILSADRNGKLPLILREPIGLVLAITPWNDPLGMVARKVAPALAAGCTVVLKPASLTPMSAMFLISLLMKAGLPKGVINMFTTLDSNKTVGALFEKGTVRKLTFTGSTSVGKNLASCASKGMVDMTLELGGNAPFIVTSDANLKKAADGVILRKFRNAGQGCTCVNRLYVEKSISHRFMEEVMNQMSCLKLGHGLDVETTMGPVIRLEEVDRLESLVKDATREGAQITWQGNKPSGDLSKGSFCAPYLLTNVSEDMEITKHEIFGPILPMLVFTDDREVIRRTNNTEYGLGAYVYSRDIERALRIADSLEAGIVGVNDHSPQTARCPVGGIKQSGLGVEGGKEGIDEYFVYKYISLNVE